MPASEPSPTRSRAVCSRCVIYLRQKLRPPGQSAPPHHPRITHDIRPITTFGWMRTHGVAPESMRPISLSATPLALSLSPQLHSPPSPPRTPAELGHALFSKRPNSSQEGGGAHISSPRAHRLTTAAAALIARAPPHPIPSHPIPPFFPSSIRHTDTLQHQRARHSATSSPPPPALLLLSRRHLRPSWTTTTTSSSCQRHSCRR